MMKKTSWIFAMLLLICGFAAAQKTQKPPRSASDSIIIAFYNVENLFDTIDDPKINDSEYLPSAKKKWNTAKYTRKIANIGRVLSSIDTNRLPAIIGLTEIENKGVLNDLINSEKLKSGRYKIVHEESNDPRGIDVALIFQSGAFKKITHSKIPVFYNDKQTRSTREILYVCGVLPNRDTLHLFVNHWKSRLGGTEETEPKRVAYAQAARHIVDSIFGAQPRANIILMGDFNDNPEDSSVAKALLALDPVGETAEKNLYNLLLPARQRGEGTLYYNDWELYDQLIVSSSLLMKKKKGITATGREGYIFKKDWLLYKTNKGVMAPSRTYSGDKYYSGYSDHLPVWMQVKW